MNRELEKYYEDQFSMMASQGWKDMLEKLEEMKAATNSLDGIETVEKLHFKKGELNIINWLLGWKEMCEKTYEDLKNETDV